MAKRSNGEGTLHKRKDGRWEARLMTGYRTDGLELGTNYTFNEWAGIWFENHKDNVTAST